ncbi:hypothetical protein EJ05DRAFT_474889 [Pseudovirgaria hyperparasitica]|uniref:GPI anchored serine-threonine rich protein n=1 Tax=Pseudovirgaria hyperparasitica TaxID=470096 RepID=A0A6A6WCQ5_9PEZI|nr:uncharacterized protein EJ05DRAFT_474889 [Pseudovirgaria hyperparasitica]KAF2759834.1 hypothetical protein EJ05DRAFT_474889 [Pseudovirgaria hyperparasitica]
MRTQFFVAALVASAASFVAAQDANCEAENIVEACLPSVQIRIDACDSQDWRCQCDTYQQLLTCYDNCPNDARKPSVQNQVTQFCAAASAYQPSSTVAPASSTPTPSAATSTTDEQPSETGSGAQETNSQGAAGVVAVPVGAVFGVLMGLAGLL